MKTCKRCVLPDTYPGIHFDRDGVCNFCKEQKTLRNEEVRADDFENEAELIECMKKWKNPKVKYDVLVPLSGGVDSSNALIVIVEKYGLRALGFHNDHGYEDEIATLNVKNLCKSLNVDLLIMQQDIKFMKQLWKYIAETKVNGLNSCYVCGNILYLNAVEAAHNFHIPLVINGYSKGQAAQVGDTEKGHDLLEKLIDAAMQTGDKEFIREFMRKYEYLEKRVPYTGRQDLNNPGKSGKMLFVPFYIFDFYKIDKEKLKRKIRKRFDWQTMKMSYPSNTTNCEMVWLNTYIDLKKMGYSNYHIEYAELVRRQEFTRDQALQDLEFNPPAGLLERLAEEVGLNHTEFAKKKDVAEAEGEAEFKGKKKLMEFEF
jgi:tRNA(Ile)-lysidine synthase TilS/MesJ